LQEQIDARRAQQTQRREAAPLEAKAMIQTVASHKAAPPSSIVPKDEYESARERRERNLEHRRALEEQIETKKKEAEETRSKRLQEDRRALEFLRQDMLANMMLDNKLR
jgi:hypothetical protein